MSEIAMRDVKHTTRTKTHVCCSTDRHIKSYELQNSEVSKVIEDLESKGYDYYLEAKVTWYRPKEKIKPVKMSANVVCGAYWDSGRL